MPKLIVRAPNHLGDCIMALPAISALRELFKESQINVVAADFVSGIYKNHISIDNVISIPDKKSHGPSSIFETARALNESGDDFEIGILLTESLSSALAFKYAGVTNIYGYTGNARSLLLKSPAVHDSRKIHRSESYIRLVRHAALKFWANPYWVEDVVFGSPDIYLRDSEIAAAKGILKRHDIDENTRFVAIAPRAVAESRRWGIDNYAELSRKIIAELNVKVALIGSADDRQFAESVCESVGDGAINLCSRFKIRGTAAILTLASAFVGNDSGPAHLAALASVPAVVISGPDDPEVTSPLSSQKTVLRRAELGCISCVKNICPLKGEKRMLCMREISVDDVYRALQGLLKRSENPRSS